MHHRDQAHLLLTLFILGIPLWWVLGLDFIVLHGFVLLLLMTCPEALRRATMGDHILLALIVTLGTSAFLNGFLLRQDITRFIAALYNLSFWVAGLILMQQVRHICAASPEQRLALLRTAYISFFVIVGASWACFVLAYALGNMTLITPSLFGLVVGDAIPDSAPHIQRHTVLVFTLIDWGLPGIPMPRVQVFGPYPTAVAISIAVLGTLSLLYLNLRHPAAWVRPLVLEGLILATVAITLTRSTLGGWVLGLLAANLLFGTLWRRFAASLGTVIIGAAIALGALDLSQAAEYRGYSSESRFDSYLHAIEETLDENPVLGLGIKPREESHIAVGSHSTVVTAFTKGGALGLALALLFLFLRPAWRWFRVWLATLPSLHPPGRQHQTTLRNLFTLQTALWVWLCFEDIDAPATAAALIFIAFAFIEQATARPSLAAVRPPAVPSRLRRTTPAIPSGGIPS